MNFGISSMEKNKIWMWSTIDGISHKSLGYQLGSRFDATLTKFIKKIDDGSCCFVMDDWPGFSRILPAKRHFIGKGLTFPIESTNSDLRHRIARFYRRSKVTTRAVDMIDTTIKRFAYLQIP